MGDRLRAHPLVRLLGFAGPHKRYVALTVGFGTVGLMLAFAYPWIIGAALDLVAAPSQAARPWAERRARLVELTQYGAATAVLHAVVLYGRGHFNVHLGNSIVTDLRRKLFDHLQTLSVGFYTRQRTGSILSRRTMTCG